MATPICPKCGAKAAFTQTRFGSRYDHCGLWAWGPFPLVDAATHAARNAAHAAFDPLWKGKKMSRTQAYQALATELGLSSAECHMKQMDRETAEAVPAAVQRINASSGRQ